MEPGGEEQFVDLSDESGVRYGAQCPLCSARFVTAPYVVRMPPALAALPPEERAREAHSQKYRYFQMFRAAFNEILVLCGRCRRAACAECWDADHQLCGECVAAVGLKRSPYRGLPSTGPLADGRIQRLSPGRFSDPTRPRWLDQLLEAPAAEAPQRGGGLSFGSSPVRLDGADILVAEPTVPIAAASQQPYGDHNAPMPIVTADLDSPEGSATSNLLECPRCGAPNYDFVTRCTSCQLQLIQLCPLCHTLNLADARSCKQCGSTLDQPSGWAEVRRPIVPMSQEEARRRQTQAPAVTYTPHRPHPTAAPQARPQAAARSMPRVNRRPSMPPPPPGNAVLDDLLFEQQTGQRPGVRYDVEPPLTRWGRLRIAFERVAWWIMLLLVMLVVGMIAAAEVSPEANAAIRAVLHIDIRNRLAHAGQFLQWIQARFFR